MNGQERKLGSFTVEHLASFPQDVKTGYLSPTEAADKLKKISSGGGLWAQKMSMNISHELLVMVNGNSLEMIEEYPLEQISLCVSLLDDDTFENLLVFSTKFSRDKVGAVHLFQSADDQASVISQVINKAREERTMRLGQLAEVMNGRSTPPVNGRSVTNEEEANSNLMTLEQRHIVSKAVQAFQQQPQTFQSKQQMSNADEKLSPIQDAKVNRDVEILNKCIEEVENFVVLLKRINEARKQLASKKLSKKKKMNDILVLQAQAPHQQKITEVFQKFKHCFNLLAKLKPHVSSPSAPELIHYLFVPLNVITKVTGLEKARAVLAPLLTNSSCDLLKEVLDSQEYHFWQSLGPNWNLTRSSDAFRDKEIPAYAPIFADGWQPQEIILNEQQEAAAKSAANMLARMKGINNPAVLLAACKFKKLGEKASLRKQQQQRIRTSVTVLQQKPPSSPPAVATVSVVYDYVAQNPKELTIRAGDSVQVIDNSRRWWLVKNQNGDQGYVPSTVLNGKPNDVNDMRRQSTSPKAASPLTITGVQSTSYNSPGPPQISERQSTPVSFPQQPVIIRINLPAEGLEMNATAEIDTSQANSSHPITYSAIVSPSALPGTEVIAAPIPQPAISQVKNTPRSGSPMTEEMRRLQLSEKQQQPALQMVDANIPLYTSSTADDVKRWLQKLSCSKRLIDALENKTALDLFQMSKESLVAISVDEGPLLFEELRCQYGAQSRNNTNQPMTEFQRALRSRIQKREGQHVSLKGQTEARSPGSPTFNSFSSVVEDEKTNL